jgi:hypothetical protein
MWSLTYISTDGAMTASATGLALEVFRQTESLPLPIKAL